ncbi:hypothetical protein GQR58_010742 [Nymphon striatum]|nr:hypothetical protein GQR58_010742 [Nymphon striatum]
MGEYAFYMGQIGPLTDTFQKHQLQIFSFSDRKAIIFTISQQVKDFHNKTDSTHKKKLHNLGITRSLQPCDPSKVIFNFSHVSLSPRIKSLLAFGLDFKLPVFKINFFRYFLSFEKLLTNLKSRNVLSSDSFTDASKQIQTIALKYFHNFKPFKIFSPIFSNDDYRILRSLSTDKSIIISKPDKGRGVVLVNKDTYINRMTDIISDPSKFSPINEPILKFSMKIEDKINNFLRKIKNLNLIPEELYKLLFVTGSGPGILYGLPKIHKPDFSTKFQFCSIFAAYNTPSFKIAKYLVSILSNLTFNSYSVKDSFQFADEIRSFPNADRYFMASFDVESLFTNVPIHETIDICISKLFPSKDSSVIGLTSSLFRRLLELATLNSFFLFNRKLFRQTEGLGMGLPLGPTMANIFVCFHEENWLENCPAQFKPVLYRRYVDDTFLLFKSESHTTQFLNYLNTKHPNIKFTMEKESQNNISFLDINIHKALNFQTSIHRKPTFTGLEQLRLEESPGYSHKKAEEDRENNIRAEFEIFNRKKNNESWLQREQVAQAEFKRKQELLLKSKAKREEQEKLIREEWKKQQLEEQKAKEEQDKMSKEKDLFIFLCFDRSFPYCSTSVLILNILE